MQLMTFRPTEKAMGRYRLYLYYLKITLYATLNFNYYRKIDRECFYTLFLIFNVLLWRHI